MLCAPVLTLGLMGQNIYAPVLNRVEQGSTTLRALKEQQNAKQKANHVGLAPDDPEVEFGYLWSHPASGGNRKDVSVTQQFDFPTAYVERARLSVLQDQSAELNYRQQRQQILLQAKQACVELVFQNALHYIYTQQTDWARKTASSYEYMLKQGEGNKLDYNKALLNQMEMENQLQQVEVNQQQQLSLLSSLAGGQSVELEVAEYAEEYSLPQDFESWFVRAEASSPALQYLGSQVKENQRQIKVARAQGLPKISVGYMGELVPSQKYNGVTVGMSIPLWENRGRVRQARTEANAAQIALEDARVQYYTQLRSLYKQAQQLQQSIHSMKHSIQMYADYSLLQRAYESGELTLAAFLTEKSYLLSVQIRLLETQRDLELVLASLEAYSL